MPTQTREKTPVNTTSLCLEEVVIDNNMLKSSENTRGPLNIILDKILLNVLSKSFPYHRSQSLKPSLIPPSSKASASGHLPAMPLNPPAKLSPSPLSAPPIPPPLCNMPPNKYLGHNTSLIFSQDARRSLDRVSHTDSSIVFVGALRSSPGMDELRYDCGSGSLEDGGRMLPVKGARADCKGSSRSSISAIIALATNYFRIVYAYHHQDLSSLAQLHRSHNVHMDSLTMHLPSWPYRRR